ncbi:MAG: cell division protein FtsL [Gammaproteobacteria bacterium]
MNSAARLLNQELILSRWTLRSFRLSAYQWVVGTLFAIVIASAVSVIYFTNQSRALYQELGALRQQEQTLKIQYGQLLLEKSTWSTQARVARIAQNQLHMNAPTSQAVITI